MTKDEFVSWLKGYLQRCETEQIETIKEKLGLVDIDESTYNYWSHVNTKNTSLAGTKLNFTINATNGSISAGNDKE